jgi:lipoate-protein ligase A
MRTWRWLDLGAVDGPTMVNLFVALAPSVGSGETPPTVVVLHPRAPFANVGFHQEADRELDLDHCRKQGIPVVRRVVGGGAILDGPWEQDYMLLVPAGTPGTEHGVEAFYERFLRPIGGALVRLGVHAERSGVNDLAVGGRKISANGAMLLDGCWVLVGDILLDLDLPAMSRVLRVPDEKFRGKLAEGMGDWLTSLRQETGQPVPRERVIDALREELQRDLGIAFAPGRLEDQERERLERLRQERSQDSWTFQKEAAHPTFRAGGEGPGRTVKIAHGVTLRRVDRKAGKLLRVTLLAREDRIQEVGISGDFFTQPFSGHLGELEQALAGARLDPLELRSILSDWERRFQVKLIGIGLDDLVSAIMEAGSDPGPRTA